MAETTVIPYLNFPGTCEAAMNFYRQALGASIDFVMRYEESPEPLPPEMAPPGSGKRILHASFRIGETVVMASDGPESEGQGGRVTLTVNVRSEGEARRFFEALSEGARVVMPMGKTFWSPAYGMLIDKFGIGWSVNTDTRA